MIMKLTNDGLRKAAILVASLDTAAADAVLDQLSPEQARQVREIVMEMDNIDQGEQRRVIDEFFHVGPKPPAKDTGVELDGRLAWLASRDGPIEAETTTQSTAPTGHPFCFLQDTEADKLVRVLANERPQTISLVLSHLAPTRAGAVLSRLPESQQVEVIRRLVDLEETDPEILHEVEEALRSRLSQQVEMQRRRVAGLQAVTGILQATESRVGMRILDNLANRDRSLAEKLSPPSLTFADLADLDNHLLAEVYDEAGPELMLPALFGAVPGLVNRILGCLPGADARAIRHKLDHPDPIRLRDVEEARKQVARIASRLNYRVLQGVVRSQESGVRS
jgi:flagellar motor switch protein FliG